MKRVLKKIVDAIRPPEPKYEERAQDAVQRVMLEIAAGRRLAEQEAERKGRRA